MALLPGVCTTSWSSAWTCVSEHEKCWNAQEQRTYPTYIQKTSIYTYLRRSMYFLCILTWKVRPWQLESEPKGFFTCGTYLVLTNVYVVEMCWRPVRLSSNSVVAQEKKAATLFCQSMTPVSCLALHQIMPHAHMWDLKGAECSTATGSSCFHSALNHCQVEASKWTVLVLLAQSIIWPLIWTRIVTKVPAFFSILIQHIKMERYGFLTVTCHSESQPQSEKPWADGDLDAI